jgi:hypothetical protein
MKINSVLIFAFTLITKIKSGGPVDTNVTNITVTDQPMNMSLVSQDLRFKVLNCSDQSRRTIVRFKINC